MLLGALLLSLYLSKRFDLSFFIHKLHSLSGVADPEAVINYKIKYHETIRRNQSGETVVGRRDETDPRKFRNGFDRNSL